jgi:hypothetical protein
VGLSGHDCPRCGRAFPPLTGRRRHTPAGRSPAGNNGKWLVVGVVAVGLVLAAVGLKYRKFDPRPTPLPAADPTTAPAATHPSQATVPTQPVSRTRALNRLETV